LNVLGTGLAVICLLLSSGCGGKGSAAANVIRVTISSSNGTNLILGISTTLTATVTGATNTDVNWTPVCQFTTTTVDSTGKSTTTKPATCPPDPAVTPPDPNHTLFGTFSNQQTTGTEVFTAPNQLPDQTKYPGLQIIITAQSVQNTKITGTISLTLNSGISVVLTPRTATVPTKEAQQFRAQLTNDIGQTTGVTWLLTQNVTTSTTPNIPQLPTCSPTCGTITPDTNNPNVAVYTAPDSVPTSITPAQKNNNNSPAIVAIVAISKADDTRLEVGTITIIQGGPITFNGITPTIAPQGATLWDIYLDAPNISSASIITLNYQDGATPPNVIGKKQFDSSNGQIKILFPIPAPATSTTTTTTNPTSIGARLRLLEQDLVNFPGAVSVLVTVADPAEPVCPPTCTAPATPPPPSAFTFTFVPVRPTSTATVPDDVVQGANTQNTRVIVDGGYFGPGGSLAQVFFQSSGNILSLDPNHPSTSRQLDTFISTSQINTGSPGLYPLFVSSNATPAPSPGNPSVTNMALFPDYSTAPPQVSGSAIPPGQNPSAIDIDPTLGVLVVAETASNDIQFYSIGNGSLTPLSTVMSTPAAPINVPTSISVNRNNHTVAVVNYGSLVKDTNGNLIPSGQSVTVLPIPGAPGTPITAFSVDLTNALQGTVSPAPMPYAIGVDPDSNLALVAYSSTSASSATNLGFIVNLNPNSGTNPYGCTLTNAITGQTGQVGQCLSAQVTLNTGIYPHIAMAPHGHLALVTPGGSGSGVIRGVDVTKPSSTNVILSSTLTAGLVTVTIDATKCPPPLPNPTSTTNPCPFSMVPGNAGSVLITGVKPTNPSNDALFNGVFTATVTSSNSFTYVVNNLTASDSASGGAVFYGSPNLIFPISNAATTQGVAINPITRTAAMANANSTGTNGPQIDLLSALDQTVSSITFFANCTAFTNPCSFSPELLATTDVAWQPYTNALVSYNPKQGLVSVSDPVSQKRYAIVSGLGPSAVAFQVSNGTTNTLTLWGGVAVDPATNQAFVLESGSGPNQSGKIEIVNLGPASSNNPKPTHISELIVPSPTPGPGVIGGISNALVPQATLTCTTPTPPATTCDLAGVQIFGSGFDSTTQVRLDGTSIPLGNVQFNSVRQLTVTIPGSLLSFPHHYALDLVNGNGVQSNAVDFLVIQSVDLSTVCTDSSGKPTNTQPSSVAIADQIANGPFSPLALVSVTGCNSIVTIDLNPTVTVSGAPQPNPSFGKLIGTPVSVGTNPQGIAIWQHRGLAVVANHGSNTASVIDLTKNPPVSPLTADVTVGTNPTGVAINEATGAAVVTNTGNNTVSMINLGLLFPPAGTTPPTTLSPSTIGGIQQPIAVAIDPDRGTNSQGIAVVTTVQLSNGSAPTGALAVVEIGLATPALSTTISSGFVSSTPTGIVFDPAVATNTTNAGVFFANSSGTNAIFEFNPDGGQSSVNVGINPTSLAVNSQTGAILTSNSASNTVSIVDTLSSPFKTRQTLGFPGSPTFGVAIDQFTNLAVIVDQANNRVLLFPMPN